MLDEGYQVGKETISALGSGGEVLVPVHWFWRSGLRRSLHPAVVMVMGVEEGKEGCPNLFDWTSFIHRRDLDLRSDSYPSFSDRRRCSLDGLVAAGSSGRKVAETSFPLSRKKASREGVLLHPDIHVVSVQCPQSVGGGGVSASLPQVVLSQASAMVVH